MNEASVITEPKASRRAPSPAKRGDRVLVATISSAAMGGHGGGVEVMTRFVVECLMKRGLEPVLAYYMPYSLAPDLSVPSFRLLRNRVGARETVGMESLEAHAVGAWLPELEFTHYAPTKQWRELISSCRYHVCVSGSVIPALVYAATKTPFVAWVATPWMGDRADRVAKFPRYRRALDKALVTPVSSMLERQVLRRGTVLALSAYTRRTLNEIARGDVVADTLPMPIDTDLFRPAPERVEAGRVAFVGRYNDPRKNTRLFFDTIKRCNDRGERVTGVLIGNEPSAEVRAAHAASGAGDRVEMLGAMSHGDLATELARADAFFIPSHQEGLCIAALEGMATACPVVSTRCGGPEEFVLDGVTGFLAESNADALADRLVSIVGDRGVRAKLGAGARRIVEERYSRTSTERVFNDAFERTFRVEAQ